MGSYRCLWATRTTRGWPTAPPSSRPVSGTPTWVLDTPTSVLETPAQVLGTPPRVLGTPMRVLDTPISVSPSSRPVSGTPFSSSFHFRSENGSSQGQILAMIGLFVSSLLDSGCAAMFSSYGMPFLLLLYHSQAFRQKKRDHEASYVQVGGRSCSGTGIMIRVYELALPVRSRSVPVPEHQKHISLKDLYNSNQVPRASTFLNYHKRYLACVKTTTFPTSVFQPKKLSQHGS